DRGQCVEVARAPDAGQKLEQPRATIVVAPVSVAAVERVVDGLRGGLLCTGRDDEQDPVVLREVEQRKLGAVARPELRAVPEEERDVGAEFASTIVQRLVRQRRVA